VRECSEVAHAATAAYVVDVRSAFDIARVVAFDIAGFVARVVARVGAIDIAGFVTRFVARVVAFDIAGFVARVVAFDIAGFVARVVPFDIARVVAFDIARVAVVVAFVALAACGDTPRKGFEDFYAGVVTRDSERALARLTPPARRALEQAAAAAHTELGAALAQTTVHSTLRSVVEIERADDTAVVEVTDALGKTERVRMQKIDGTWRVDAR
jgi:hypothetical protein